MGRKFVSQSCQVNAGACFPTMKCFKHRTPCIEGFHATTTSNPRSDSSTGMEQPAKHNDNIYFVEIMFGHLFVGSTETSNMPDNGIDICRTSRLFA